MIDIQDIIRAFSLLSFLFNFLKRPSKTISMAITLASQQPPPRLDYFSSSPVSRLQPFIIKEGASIAVENQVIAKSEKLALGSKENEKTDLAHLHKRNVLQENMLLEINSSGDLKVGRAKGIKMPRKRPACLVIPELCPIIGFGEEDKIIQRQEFEVEGERYFLASKKGKKEVMEDGYGVLTNIMGDSKQAFFAVVDGHGGREATDYVVEHLGKNIVKSLDYVKNDSKDENQVKAAIKRGYFATDNEFLSQGLNGGACVSSVLLRHGQLHVANVGDCRVVLSRKQIAHALTTDHRINIEEERNRIERTGGYVHCQKGVWRVNGSLAVSRAIGDMHFKQWVISEPDINIFSLTPDCEFLIIASDGLWDKVDDQEAVDVALRGKNARETCKKLVDISFSRGNKDDITVMIINLQHFVKRP